MWSAGVAAGSVCLCRAPDSFGHAQHILIRRWAASCLSPQPLSFQCEHGILRILRHLIRVSCIRRRVDGGGRRGEPDPLDTGPLPPLSLCYLSEDILYLLTQFIPHVLLWMLNNHIMIIILIIINIHSRRSHYDSTAPNLSVAESWQSPAWHPICVGSESNSVCSW